MHRKYYPFTIAGDLKDQKVKHMTADFETCLNEDKTDVRVWAWGLADIFTEEFEHGKDIESYLDRVLNDKTIYDIGFHNLKFDGNYLLPAIYKRGYEYVHNRIFMNDWKSGKDMRGKFTHSISDGGAFYNIIVVKDKPAAKNTPSFVYFWDTMKLFPDSLKKVGEQYNTIHHKIDEDAEFYEETRPIGHDLTVEELKYLREDCLTLAEALRVQINKYGKIYRTRASKAFSFFKECCTLHGDRVNVYDQHYVGTKEFIIPRIKGYEDLEGMKFKYLPTKAKKELIKNKLIPAFDYFIKDFATWQDFKHAYHGGITYVQPEWQEKSIERAITTIDVNSMYPFIMWSKNIPYGAFEKRDGEPTESTGTWIACARVSFKLKEEYNLPCIQIKSKYGREWLRCSTDYRERGEIDAYNDDVIWFTKVDFETFKMSYDFTVHHWIEYYYFPQIGRMDGQKFIDKYYAAKQDAQNRADAIKAKHNNDSEKYTSDLEYVRAMLDRTEAKVIMNSAYGKHGTQYVIMNQNTEYTEGEPLRFPIDRDVFNCEPEDPSHYYIPYAAFVTAYARQLLVSTWNAFKGRAIYCDTDSIHFLGTPSDIPATLRDRIDWDQTGALGLWGIEGEFVAGRYIRAKTYIEVDADGVQHVTCAGAPSRVKKLMNWDTFRVGFNAWEIVQSMFPNADDVTLIRAIKAHSKLTPKRYPSGVNLEPVNFEIKPVLHV